MLSSSQHDLSPADRDKLLARYTLHSRAEILFQLRAIQKRKLLVNLDLTGSRQIVVTSVLAVNEANNTLILDSARGDALNHELMSGKGAEFIAQIDGVSITFATGPVTLCDYEKLPALRMAMPKSLIRLQRREHFRVPLPIAHPVKCIVPSTWEATRIRSPLTSWISAAAVWRLPIRAGASGRKPAESLRLPTAAARDRRDRHLAGSAQFGANPPAEWGLSDPSGLQVH